MPEKKAVCPLCGSSEIAAGSIEHVMIRHMDFQPMENQPRRLHSCMRCKLIFQRDSSVHSEIRDMYRGVSYTRTRNARHVVIDAGETFRETYDEFAEILAANVPVDDPSILDIGCFDGEFLIRLAQIYPDSSFHGYDIAPALSELFPKRERFHFHSQLDAINSLSRKIDVVLMVNSLMYVDDFSSLMEKVESCLKPGGIIFAVCPDTRVNPWFLTCGDQLSYLTPATISNFFSIFGFQTEIIECGLRHPRNLITVSRRSPADRDFQDDATLEAGLRHLKQARERLFEIVSTHRAQPSGGRLCVLGCTNNAAWAGNLIGEAIDAFVDQNTHRIGSTFYGRPVLSPRDLDERDLVVIPYGATAAPISERLRANYGLKTQVI